ncbi:hypothetical protein DPMN_020899 [Dreissena polymorpha]|uniref:Uncharacterized protein n=1 Tax=Dreissena polymorpha TaxID=45954 RepID=A0A9D4NJT7_DREPO|nr:hypothetical protein DPMN_020899 [Dreissena polymorpha]
MALVDIFRDLLGNQLRNISRATFRGLAKLRILSLLSNQLESIDDGAFEGMPDLYELKCIWRDFPSFVIIYVFILIIVLTIITLIIIKR